MALAVSYSYYYYCAIVPPGILSVISPQHPRLASPLPAHHGRLAPFGTVLLGPYHLAVGPITVARHPFAPKSHQTVFPSSLSLRT